MPKKGRLLTFWDECKLVRDELSDRKNELAAEIRSGEITEEEIEHQIWQDGIYFEIKWENMTERITEKMLKRNPGGYWKVEVVNFGWRKQSGCKYFFAKDGEELIRQVLPNCRNTFYVYNFGKGFAIQNYHHDSPCGEEWYYIIPVAESRYCKYAV
jgi:hypothetical protein